MPVIHAANSPVTPAATRGPTSGAGGSAASRDATTSPFAAMLAQQAAEPAADGGSGKKAVQAEQGEPRDADAATQNANMAAILPMLLNDIQLGAAAVAGNAPVADSDKPGKDTSATENQVDSGELVVAAPYNPASPTSSAGKMEQSVSPATTPISDAQTMITAADVGSRATDIRNPETPVIQPGLSKGTTEEAPATQPNTAKSAAIVAASSEYAVAGKGDATQRGFEAMLIQADKVRATEGVSQATVITSHTSDEFSAANELEPAVGAIPTNTTGAPVQSGTVPEYRITAPLGNHHWESTIGNSMVVMTGSRQDRADLVLTPPQLGRIEVSVSMNGDQASATFVSASPTVREALENALPRLKEILADAGITLGHTHVGSESLGQSASNSGSNDSLRQNAIADFENKDIQIAAASRDGATRLTAPRGLIDVFA